ncbi:thioredoxin domain-containing protein [Candidatus Methylacidiphilum fumarolicum]|uniref:Spermatogenesis-associated protein 20-like TRX domain-containing protein n=2 Tax=Candidatus Methylacidiphilum fumarolicum TaxID=591154 RepID=I0K0T2_METFB|nr:thioredoxin domain-containing protein [Candidatus Methylacidiphilum fumarolicum]MBW6414023.1 thioredoxin domain-containing protein [Candidatus Methylacidiphilum fumarolicum]TFE66373.1 thioredoxin [Candidatus Methylacidiphilum fumarolicum]TFE75286.1 thioredoxin domain-containing protein [Candidatus Methylacidiphilum fumarolicum]TFE76102.1 thioredoxin domain-containing protein [Candidatus Methylacidiphilum fumarolicum]TFE77244.1 thioredoxin [Candidatus Methylacidiphilum fumarolicum]
MNTLSKEKSPYLLQHAHNPVQWQPWTEATIQKAKELNRPIFLSVGYSTCHWCHVMAEESFENPTVAELLNAFYIPVKVDREERPDIDQFYMEFVQAFCGQGGWPMSVWLTPDLEPFFGGTYFPLESKWGRPGFIDLLKKIANLWQSHRSALQQQGQEILNKMRESILCSIEIESQPNLTQIARKTVEQLWGNFDRVYGGFSPPPKFPRPNLFFFLFRAGSFKELPDPLQNKAMKMALFTLQKMSCGGIHDILEGGFHRYSVDAQWRLPHFEKMLYDQAHLGSAYLEAFQMTSDFLFKETATALFEYLFSHLYNPAGGFYSAEDADSLNSSGEKAEGAYYLWTMEELEKILEEVVGKERSKVLASFFGATNQGNLAEGLGTEPSMRLKNMLFFSKPLSALAEELKMPIEETKDLLLKAKTALKEARLKRPKPFLDDKIITAWNGYAISALAKAYMVLADSRYLNEAKKTADFILEHLWDADSKILYRIYRNGRGSIPGFASDYASLAASLLDLFEADQDEKWLLQAKMFQELLEEKFADPYRHQYLSRAVETAATIIQTREEYDGAEPATLSLSAYALWKLFSITGEEKWKKRLEELFNSAWPILERFPTALPYFLGVYLEYSVPPIEIIIVGEKDDLKTRALFNTLSSVLIPNRLFLVLDPRQGVPRTFKSIDFYSNLLSVYPGYPIAYICARGQCSLPQTEPEKALEILKSHATLFLEKDYLPSLD